MCPPYHNIKLHQIKGWQMGMPMAMDRCRHAWPPCWTQHRWPRPVHRRIRTIAVWMWILSIALAHVRHWPVWDYCVWVSNTERYKHMAVLLGNQIFYHVFCCLSNSIPPVGPALPHISAENIAGRTRTATAATRPNCIRRLYHRVRCDTGIVRTVTIAELMLFIGLCDPISVCC